jgi:hypothetical protein
LLGAAVAALADHVVLIPTTLRWIVPTACCVGGMASAGWLIYRGLTNRRTVIAVCLCSAGLILFYEDFLLGRTILRVLTQ